MTLLDQSHQHTGLMNGRVQRVTVSTLDQPARLRATLEARMCALRAAAQVSSPGTSVSVVTGLAAEFETWLLRDPDQ